MISLILSGGSPVVCRELAGHESFDISSNYYANLSTVVESIVYEKHREHRGELSMEGSLRLRTAGQGVFTEVEGGSCDFSGIREGDISVTAISVIAGTVTTFIRKSRAFRS